jgi:catechol 2,3-dioxygenase-like lactoylglutathione lyase family enzyme
MLNPNFVLLYVTDPVKSAAFYTELLGQQPVDIAPTFTLFVLSSGLKLGLWLKGNVKPDATAHTGGSELCISVESADRVRAIYAAWAERGLPMLQTPTEMDFGHTFVAEDPDGHRLRVFAPSAP